MSSGATEVEAKRANAARAALGGQDPYSSERWLHKMWSDWHEVAMCRHAGLEPPATNVRPSALEALEAGRLLVGLLVGRRWLVVAAARAAGASWADIGEALGVTRQAAHVAYAEAMQSHERFGVSEAQRATLADADSP